MSDPFEPTITTWPETTDPGLIANLDAERAILGLIMWNADLADEVVDQLGADDFYDPRNGLIYSMLRRRYLANEPLDAVSLAEALARSGELRRAGAGGYLHTLIAGAHLSSSLPEYVRVVAERALRRRLVAAHTRAAGVVVDPAVSATEAVGRVQELLANLDAGDDHSGIRFGDAVGPVLDAIQLGEASAGLMTGLVDLDRIINGSRPGNLLVIAGRQGSGKSTLLRDVARHLAFRQGHPVAFFSLEMSREEVVMCLVSALSGAPLDLLRNNRLTDDEWVRVAKAVSVVDQAPLTIYDAADMSVIDIRAHARKAKRRSGLVAIFIDYVQLVRADATAQNREQEVARISRALKILAKELGIVVYLAAQLNRMSEGRADKRPQLSDIRESDAIASDADAVILVHRPDYYDPNDIRAGEADFIVAKHRHGKTGTAVVAAQLDRSRFANLMAA